MPGREAPRSAGGRPSATLAELCTGALHHGRDEGDATAAQQLRGRELREASRRAQWKALGLTDADIQKPKIAVVNSSSELAICFSHLDGIAAIVKEAIRAAGGLPFEIRTAAPSDFIIAAGAAAATSCPAAT